MNAVKGEFGIDIEHLHALGVMDPYSPKSLEIYKSGKLTSNERLYFSLWGSKLLSAVSFEAKKKVFEAGSDIAVAYFIVSGSLLSIEGDNIERLGPGSVIGLAEGLVGMRFNKTILSVTPVQARVIPLHKVDQIIPKLPDAFRGIFQNTIKRTLGVDQLPPGLL